MMIRALQRGFQALLCADLTWLSLSSRNLTLAVAGCSIGGGCLGVQIRHRGQVACQAVRVVLLSLIVFVAVSCHGRPDLTFVGLAYIAFAGGTMISMCSAGGRRSRWPAFQPSLAMVQQLLTPPTAA